VRSLIEAMGGEITVRSTPGVGTTFAVALDRADREPAGPPAPSDDDGIVLPVVEPSIVREFMRQIGIPSRKAMP
jgi:hypothetical protein